MPYQEPSRLLSILMISPQFRPIVGGYERAAELLSLALAKRGHEVCVVAERRNPTWPKIEDFGRVTLCRWWCLYRPHFHILSSLLGLSGYLLRNGRRFDVWHIHQYGIHAAVAVVLGKIMGRPVVMKLTSSSDQGLSGMVSQLRFPRLMTTVLRRVDAVVALSRETVAEALAFGIPRVRVHLLGNGLDTEKYSPTEQLNRATIKDALGLGNLSVALFVGRLSNAKNPVGLLQAWYIIKDTLPADWKLVLVGDGPIRPAVESSIDELGLSSRVVIAGQRDDTDHWMKAADIYVLPSHREGLSNALLEAMATGLPIVATRVSGVSELVDETGAGFVVDVDDMKGLGQAMLRLGCDPALRASMGNRARHVVKCRFSINRVATAHVELYHQLIGGS